MNPTASTLSPEVRSSGLDWLRRELAPTPGRAAVTSRIAITVVLVVIISMALQIPEASLSAYMVFFVTKENRVVTTLVGVMTILGLTIAMAVSILLYHSTFDLPALRVPVIAVVLFAGFFFSRVFAIGPLAFGIGFILAATQSIAELMPSAEYLVHSLLWLWVAIAYPIVLSMLVTTVLVPKAPAGPPRPHKQLIAPDAFTNPVYVQFALKVTLAAMICYIIYTGLDWAGIHTALITCCFISLESTRATLQKGALRLAGCLVGGLLGFLSIMYLIPRMESIVSLILLVGAVSILAGWVAAGSERIAYAGLQIALAFFMCVLQDFEPDTDFEKIRDRLIGIILGIVVTTLVFRFIWPDSENHSRTA